MTRAEISIKGLVQGVGYRRFAEKRALELGLTGWVKNDDDGQVSCVVEGEHLVIEQFIIKLKKGPAFSRVNDVKVSWNSATSEFTTFDILT